MISASALMNVVVWLLILGLVVWLIWWVIGYINPPEPINKLLRVGVIITAVVILITFLLSLTGNPVISFK